MGSSVLSLDVGWLAVEGPEVAEPAEEVVPVDPAVMEVTIGVAAVELDATDV